MNNMIRPDIVKRNAAGDFSIREIVRIVLYFNKSHQSIAPGIRDVIVGFVDLVPSAAFGYYYGMDGEAEAFSPESFSALMDLWFSGPFLGY